MFSYRSLQDSKKHLKRLKLKPKLMKESDTCKTDQFTYSSKTESVFGCKGIPLTHSVAKGTQHQWIPQADEASGATAAHATAAAVPKGDDADPAWGRSMCCSIGLGLWELGVVVAPTVEHLFRWSQWRESLCSYSFTKVLEGCLA